MQPLVETRVPFAAFFAAIACSAIVGGVGPGLLAAVLGGAAVSYYFLPPAGFAVQGIDNWSALGLYMGVSAGLLFLAGMQQRARGQAELLGLRARTPPKRAAKSRSPLKV
jgi:K+-sensing histidine kinase KdpD